MARTVNLSPFSRYLATPLFQDKDDKGQAIVRHFWGTYERIEIPVDDEKDAFFTVTEAFIGRFDRLADEFYGDASLWWVIAQVNNIFDQRSVAVNTVLRIPASENVFLALSTINI